MDTAVSLKQVEHVAVLVTKHLDFYVPERRERRRRGWEEVGRGGKEGDGGRKKQKVGKKRRGEDVEKRERRGKGREMEERGGGEAKGEWEKW